jgi:hypothetical protein
MRRNHRSGFITGPSPVFGGPPCVCVSCGLRGTELIHGVPPTGQCSQALPFLSCDKLQTVEIKSFLIVHADSCHLRRDVAL